MTEREAFALLELYQRTIDMMLVTNDLLWAQIAERDSCIEALKSTVASLQDVVRASAKARETSNFRLTNKSRKSPTVTH